MKTVLFKPKNADNDWYGIAVARDINELFWVIDEHVDPFSCVIAVLKEGAVMFQAHPVLGSEEDEMELDNVEISESVWDAPCGKIAWKAPEWPDTVYRRIGAQI
jgi:hypothetical protein